MDADQIYVARLISAGSVHQEIEFAAPDGTTAWIEGNDGIDPLQGLWVEVKEKPDPQEQLAL